MIPSVDLLCASRAALRASRGGSSVATKRTMRWLSMKAALMPSTSCKAELALIESSAHPKPLGMTQAEAEAGSSISPKETKPRRWPSTAALACSSVRLAPSLRENQALVPVINSLSMPSMSSRAARTLRSTPQPLPDALRA